MKSVNAIIIKDKKVFLIKRKEGLHSGKWAFPGGIVESKESIEEGLIREIKEETNLKVIKIIKKIADYSYLRKDGNITNGSSFLVDVSGEININEKEISKSGFFSIEELEKLNLAPGIEAEALLALNN